MSNGQDIVDVGGQDIIQPYSQYVIDLVFCIDSTRSMGGIIEQTKEQCGEIVGKVSTLMRETQRPLKAFRAGIVEFRDLEQDKAKQMVVHDFVDVLDANGDPSVAALTDTLSKIEARGGGDAPESSLDALCRAFKLPFYEPAADESIKLRRVIVLFTDEPPRPIHATTKEAGEESLSDKDIVLVRANAVLKQLEQRVLFVVPECQEFSDLAAALPFCKQIRLDRLQGDVGVYKPEDFGPVLDWTVKSATTS